MKRNLTIYLLTVLFLVTAPVFRGLGQCTAPKFYGINCLLPFGTHVAFHSYTQPGTYYLEHGPVGFTPGTNASPGVGGTVQVLSSSYGISAFNPGVGTRSYYVRLHCNNNTWTPNSPVVNYTTTGTMVPTIAPLFGLNSPGTADLNSFGYPSLFNGCWGGAIGDERRFRFDCPDTSYYIVTLTGNHNNGYADFSYKELNSSAASGSYFCASAYDDVGIYPGYSLKYQVGPLHKGKAYDLLLDGTSASPYYVSINVTCPEPENISINNIEPTSVRLNWSCNCADSVIVEYGAPNFVPGTGNTPGVGGSLLVANSSPLTISGLTPFTAYDVYIRSVCGGNYTPNRIYKTKTAKDCNSFPVINCNTNAVFNYVGSGAVRGAWDNLGCANGDSSEERVYKFTPTTSGYHILHVTNFVASHTGYVYTAHYSYKPESAGCNELGWTCIGTSYQNPLSFTPQAIAFGPLTAGTTYYIGTDGQSFPSTRTYTYTFHIECPQTCPPPPTPGAITVTGGNTPICPTVTRTFSIAPVVGATTYIWTAPTGTTITSGQSSTTVTIQFGSSFPPSDTVRVVAVSVCGLSAQQKLKVTKAVPATPGTITVTGGIANVCPGDTRTYTIAPVSGATYYNWNLPPGASYTSGQGTTSLNVIYYTNFVNNDTIRVTASNSCGASLQRKLSVKRNNPAVPGAVTVTGGIAKVCPGETRTYTIAPAAGANSYTWTKPTGSTIISGQGTLNVNIQYNAGFTATDTLRVVSVNGCGSSAQRKLTVARNIPATPAAVTGQNFGLCNLTSIPFSTTNVAGMTYNWTTSVPSATIASGQGTSSITANFGVGFLSGTLSVTATNTCGTSGARNLSVYAKPATPAAISGSLAVCVNQQDVPYSIVPLTNVTNYTWSGPTGSHISDGIVTSASNTLITTSTAVTVDYATSGGTLKVRGNNACASGSYKSVTVAIVCREAAPQNSASENFNPTIIPNPNTGEFSILLPDNLKEPITATVLDLPGNIVFRFEIANNTENSFDLDLPNGIYLIRFQTNDRTVTRKMIIQ